MIGDWLSGPLRMSMILAAEGKHKEAAAMFDRYNREIRANAAAAARRRLEADPCADCAGCRCLDPWK